MSWLFDLLRAPWDLLRAGSAPSPPPEPRFGMLLGTVVVLCSGVLTTACLRRKRFLRGLFRSIFLPGDAAARDAAALIRSLSNIDADSDDSANPALLELQRTEEDYVEDLRALAHAKAGLVKGGLLSAAKAELLFSNAPVLLALNEEFLATLNSSDSSPLLTGAQPSIDVVAAAFASLGPYFRLYAEYAKNYFRPPGDPGGRAELPRRRGAAGGAASAAGGGERPQRREPRLAAHQAGAAPHQVPVATARATRAPA